MIELKLKNSEENSTEVGSGSMNSSKKDMPALIEKLLQKDKGAKSKLQKLALCLEMAQQEYGLSILLAYL